MTAPLSQDRRERIVRAVADGSSIRQAAERFQVSASAAIKLMQRVRQTGSTAPAKIGVLREAGTGGSPPRPRKAAARTRDELWTAIGSLLDTITATECRNYILNSGYEFV